MAKAKEFGKHFPVMENMTVKEVRNYLETKNSIIIPIGVIEQHGYHLPLSTDKITSTGIAQRIAEKTGILMAPCMYESFSGGGLEGTVNISPATMSLVISDRLVSLVSQGFRNFYLYLGHGGSENKVALDNALQLLLRMNPAFENALISLMAVWDFDPNDIGWGKAIREGDWHAGWIETSLLMALEPDLVQMDQLELDEEPWLQMQIDHPDNYQHAEKIVDDKLVVPRMTQRPEIKVGVMGYPERASAELGNRIIEDVVNAASERIMEIESKADGEYKEVEFNPPPLIFGKD